MNNYIKLKYTLYGNNIYANKRADILMKQVDKINKHYETFKIINLNTQIQAKFNQKVLDSLSRLQFENEYVYQKNIKDESQIYNYLDFQVHTIKNMTSGLTKKLEDIGKIIIGIQEIMGEVDFKNKELADILKFYNKTFLNAKVRILKLNRSLNVNNEDDIIIRFKEESLKYESFFNNVNNHI